MMKKTQYPDADKCERLKNRHQLFQKIRSFFNDQDFIEIHSPLLVPNPGLEPELIPFETQFEPGMGGGLRKSFFLPTSPEYHLKKALALGLPKIFEITKSFRNGELSPTHEPEFFMMEWYRHPGELRDIARDFAQLAAHLGTDAWQRHEDISVEEAFRKYAHLDLRACLKGEACLVESARARGYASINADDSFEDAFHKIILEKIEPQLGRNGLSFLWHYPAALCSMARLVPGDPLFCERFEVYWQGIELANAFGELTDALEQRKRCEEDQAKRLKLYGKTPPLDEEFFRALASLAGPAAGIAVGLDRLVQCLLGFPTIQDVIAFPHKSSV